MRLQAFAVRRETRSSPNMAAVGSRSSGSTNPLSSAQIQKSVGDFVSQSAQWLLDAFTKLVSGGAALFSFLSLLIVTPVVAFYILVDWRRMISKLNSLAPPRPSRKPAKHRPRDKSCLGGFHSRPVDRLPLLGGLVQRRVDVDRARLRLSDWRCRRRVELRALCRLADRARAFS